MGTIAITEAAAPAIQTRCAVSRFIVPSVYELSGGDGAVSSRVPPPRLYTWAGHSLILVVDLQKKPPQNYSGRCAITRYSR